jgi:hypothetical protein
MTNDSAKMRARPKKMTATQPLRLRIQMIMSGEGLRVR